MDAQMLKIISYFCFGFAVLFLLIAVILFFRFRVRELIAKLSGKQEAQQIREIRGHIGATKSNAAHYVFDHGVDTDNTTQILEDSMETVLLEKQKTKLLDDEKTTLLGSCQTVLLNVPQEEPSGELILLQDEMEIHIEKGNDVQGSEEE